MLIEAGALVVVLSIFLLLSIIGNLMQYRTNQEQQSMIRSLVKRNGILEDEIERWRNAFNQLEQNPNQTTLLDKAVPAAVVTGVFALIANIVKIKI